MLMSLKFDWALRHLLHYLVNNFCLLILLIYFWYFHRFWVTPRYGWFLFFCQILYLLLYTELTPDWICQLLVLRQSGWLTIRNRVWYFQLFQFLFFTGSLKILLPYLCSQVHLWGMFEFCHNLYQVFDGRKTTLVDNLVGSLFLDFFIFSLEDTSFHRFCWFNMARSWW